jgi:hypothetical protein
MPGWGGAQQSPLSTPSPHLHALQRCILSLSRAGIFTGKARPSRLPHPAGWNPAMTSSKKPGYFGLSLSGDSGATRTRSLQASSLSPNIYCRVVLDYDNSNRPTTISIWPSGRMKVLPADRIAMRRCLLLLILVPVAGRQCSDGALLEQAMALGAHH